MQRNRPQNKVFSNFEGKITGPFFLIWQKTKRGPSRCDLSRCLTAKKILWPQETWLIFGSKKTRKMIFHHNENVKRGIPFWHQLSLLICTLVSGKNKTEAIIFSETRYAYPGEHTLISRSFRCHSIDARHMAHDKDAQRANGGTSCQYNTRLSCYQGFRPPRLIFSDSFYSHVYFF